MPRHSKRYLEIRQRVDRTKFYSIDEAIDLVKKNATAKFDETMELHLATNIDPKRPEQQIRGTVILPHGTGRTVRVLVFAKGDKAEEAKKAGADVVGGDELVEKILNEGFTDFDVAIATPDMMKSVGKLGKILGPRGLMPSPKSGTVTDDVVSTVKEFKMGRVEVRSDKTGSVHLPIGKCSFDAQKLKENLISAYKQIVSMRPAGIKGQFIRKAVLTSTMGVGVKLNFSELEAAKI